MELITRKEAAKRLDIHPTTLDKMRLDGLIPAVKIYQTFKYNWPEVLQALGLPTETEGRNEQIK